MITKRLLTPVALLAMVLSGSVFASGGVYSDKSFRKANRDGDRSFFIRMSGGERVTLAKNGPIAFVAECTDDNFGGGRIEIFATTTEVATGTTDGTWTTSGQMMSPSLSIYSANFSFPSVIDFGPAAILSENGRSLSFQRGLFAGVGIQGAACTVSGEVVYAREGKKKRRKKKD